MTLKLAKNAKKRTDISKNKKMRPKWDQKLVKKAPKLK